MTIWIGGNSLQHQTDLPLRPPLKALDIVCATAVWGLWCCILIWHYLHMFRSHISGCVYHSTTLHVRTTLSPSLVIIEYLYILHLSALLSHCHWLVILTGCDIPRSDISMQVPVLWCVVFPCCCNYCPCFMRLNLTGPHKVLVSHFAR